MLTHRNTLTYHNQIRRAGQSLSSETPRAARSTKRSTTKVQAVRPVQAPAALAATSEPTAGHNFVLLLYIQNIQTIFILNPHN